VVSLAGVLDLRAGHALALSDGAVALFLGGSPDEAPGAYAAASPIELPLPHVRQRLLHGDRDPDVPLELSVRYRDAKVARGEDVALAILPGVGHFEPMDPTSAAWPEVLAAIRDARGA
jgi:pimeloyl-ACP methyl ester carboxylesterase